MLGIIFACLGLGGAIAWKIWRIGHPNTKEARDVGKEFDGIKDRSKDASKAIFAIETKVWGKGEELKPEDFAAIKAEHAKLVACEDELRKLLDLLRVKNLEDSLEKQQILPFWLQARVWLNDAGDLLENQKPPEYGGLNVPMFLATDRIRKAQDQLKEINTLKDEIIKRNDPAEIKTTRKKISELRDSFRAQATRLQELDKYVADTLSRPDLTSKEVMELDQLRDEANKASMAVRASGDLLKAFPE